MAGNVSLIEGVQGGGLLDDAVVVLRNPHFVMSSETAYGKSMSKTAPLFNVTMTETLEDGSELDHDQYLSLGGADDFIPSEDGLGLVKVGTKSSIVNDTNFLLFIRSIMDAGFPTEKIKDENDISFIDGLKCHVVRKAKERKGLDSKKEQTYLFVDKLYLDEKPAAGKKKAGAGAGGKAAAEKVEEEDTAVVDATKDILMQVLASQPENSIAKSKLLTVAMPLLKGNSLMRQIITLLVKDDFLNQQAGWTYDKGVIAL